VHEAAPDRTASAGSRQRRSRCNDDGLGVVDAGDHDHRNILQRGVALDVLQYRYAVELGHDDVEQDDVARVVV
jgi:hypothetical protein